MHFISKVQQLPTCAVITLCLLILRIVYVLLYILSFSASVVLYMYIETRRYFCNLFFIMRKFTICLQWAITHYNTLIHENKQISAMEKYQYLFSILIRRRAQRHKEFSSLAVNYYQIAYNLLTSRSSLSKTGKTRELRIAQSRIPVSRLFYIFY